jgi:beta-glucanase (GH16 family)
MSAMEMTFNEEFKSLDIAAGPGARWSAHTPWNGDFGDAAFSNPGPDGPFSLTPEGLRITASKGKDGHWRSGLICSVDKDGAGQRGFMQQYGYFEMKARLPSGMGTWPAFWLIGTDKRHSSAEIDVAEFYGGFSRYYHTVAIIWRKNPPGSAKNDLITVPPNLLSSQFNTFGVLIEPERTRFYFNRQEVSELPTPPEFRQPMYMLVDLALGGGWPIDSLQSPLFMDVAYVRAFTRPDLALQAKADAPPP